MAPQVVLPNNSNPFLQEQARRESEQPGAADAGEQQNPFLLEEQQRQQPRQSSLAIKETFAPTTASLGAGDHFLTGSTPLEQGEPFSLFSVGPAVMDLWWENFKPGAFRRKDDPSLWDRLKEGGPADWGSFLISPGQYAAPHLLREALKFDMPPTAKWENAEELKLIQDEAIRRRLGFDPRWWHGFKHKGGGWLGLWPSGAESVSARILNYADELGVATDEVDPGRGEAYGWGEAWVQAQKTILPPVGVAVGFAEAMTSGPGVSTLGLAAVAPVALTAFGLPAMATYLSVGISAGFTVDILLGALTTFPKAMKRLWEGDYDKAYRATLEGLLYLYMGRQTYKHTMQRVEGIRVGRGVDAQTADLQRKMLSEDNIPKTANELANVLDKIKQRGKPLPENLQLVEDLGGIFKQSLEAHQNKVGLTVEEARRAQEIFEREGGKAEVDPRELTPKERREQLEILQKAQNRAKREVRGEAKEAEVQAARAELGRDPIQTFPLRRPTGEVAGVREVERPGRPEVPGQRSPGLLGVIERAKRQPGVIPETGLGEGAPHPYLIRGKPPYSAGPQKWPVRSGTISPEWAKTLYDLQEGDPGYFLRQTVRDPLPTSKRVSEWEREFPESVPVPREIARSLETQKRRLADLGSYGKGLEGRLADAKLQLIKIKRDLKFQLKRKRLVDPDGKRARTIEKQAPLLEAKRVIAHIEGAQKQARTDYRDLKRQIANLERDYTRNVAEEMRQEQDARRAEQLPFKVVEQDGPVRRAREKYLAEELEAKQERVAAEWTKILAEAGTEAASKAVRIQVVTPIEAEITGGGIIVIDKRVAARQAGAEKRAAEGLPVEKVGEAAPPAEQQFAPTVKPLPLEEPPIAESAQQQVVKEAAVDALTKAANQQAVTPAFGKILAVPVTPAVKPAPVVETGKLVHTLGRRAQGIVTRGRKAQEQLKAAEGDLRALERDAEQHLEEQALQDYTQDREIENRYYHDAGLTPPHYVPQRVSNKALAQARIRQEEAKKKYENIRAAYAKFVPALKAHAQLKAAGVTNKVMQDAVNRGVSLESLALAIERRADNSVVNAQAAVDRLAKETAPPPKAGAKQEQPTGEDPWDKAFADETPPLRTEEAVQEAKDKIDSGTASESETRKLAKQVDEAQSPIKEGDGEAIKQKLLEQAEKDAENISNAAEAVAEDPWDKAFADETKVALETPPAGTSADPTWEQVLRVGDRVPGSMGATWIPKPGQALDPRLGEDAPLPGKRVRREGMTAEAKAAQDLLAEKQKIMAKQRDQVAYESMRARILRMKGDTLVNIEDVAAQVMKDIADATKKQSSITAAAQKRIAAGKKALESQRKGWELSKDKRIKGEVDLKALRAIYAQERAFPTKQIITEETQVQTQLERSRRETEAYKAEQAAKTPEQLAKQEKFGETQEILDEIKSIDADIRLAEKDVEDATKALAALSKPRRVTPKGQEILNDRKADLETATVTLDYWIEEKAKANAYLERAKVAVQREAQAGGAQRGVINKAVGKRNAKIKEEERNVTDGELAVLNRKEKLIGEGRDPLKDKLLTDLAGKLADAKKRRAYHNKQRELEMAHIEKFGRTRAQKKKVGEPEPKSIGELMQEDMLETKTEPGGGGESETGASAAQFGDMWESFEETRLAEVRKAVGLTDQRKAELDAEMASMNRTSLEKMLRRTLQQMGLFAPVKKGGETAGDFRRRVAEYRDELKETLTPEQHYLVSKNKIVEIDPEVVGVQVETTSNKDIEIAAGVPGVQGEIKVTPNPAKDFNYVVAQADTTIARRLLNAYAEKGAKKADKRFILNTLRETLGIEITSPKHAQSAGEFLRNLADGLNERASELRKEIKVKGWIPKGDPTKLTSLIDPTEIKPMLEYGVVKLGALVARGAANISTWGAIMRKEFPNMRAKDINNFWVAANKAIDRDPTLKSKKEKASQVYEGIAAEQRLAAEMFEGHPLAPTIQKHFGNISIDPAHAPVVIEAIADAMVHFTRLKKDRPMDYDAVRDRSQALVHADFNKGLRAMIPGKPEIQLTEFTQGVGDLFAGATHRVWVTSNKVAASARADAQAKGGRGEADIELVMEELEAHASMRSLTAFFTAHASELGSALNQLKSIKSVLARDTIMGDHSRARTLLARMGKTPAEISEISTKLAQFKDPVDIYQFIKDMRKPKFNDYMSWYVFTNYLGNITTFERNGFGTGVNLGLNIPAQVLALPRDISRAAYKSMREGKLPTEKNMAKHREIYLGDIGRQLSQVTIGMRDGWHKASQIIKNGYNIDNVTSFDLPRTEILTGTKWEIPANMIGRTLDATDIFFRSIDYAMEYEGLLYSRAKRNTAGGGDFQTEYERLRTNPKYEEKVEMGEAAASRAMKSVFREDVGVFVNKLLQIKRDTRNTANDRSVGPRRQNVARAGSLLLDVMFPFIKTPANLLAQGIEMTPGYNMIFRRPEGRKIGEAIPGVKKLYEGKEKPPEYSRAEAQAHGRRLLGTLTLIPMAQWAMEGKLTGSMESYSDEEKAARYTKGQRPHSFLVSMPPNVAEAFGSTPAEGEDGEYWVSYSWMVPLATPLSFVANIVESMKNRKTKPESAEDMISAFSQSQWGALNSILDQSYLQGVFELSEAMRQPETNFWRPMAQAIRGLIPFSTQMGAFMRMHDPIIRNSDTFYNRIRPTLPWFFGKPLPYPRADIYGDVMRRHTQAVQGTWTRGVPINHGELWFAKLSPAKKDPVTDELILLGRSVGYLSPVSPKDMAGRDKREVVPAEKFVQDMVRGKVRRRQLERLMASNIYQEQQKVGREAKQRMDASRAGSEEYARHEFPFIRSKENRRKLRDDALGAEAITKWAELFSTSLPWTYDARPDLDTKLNPESRKKWTELYAKKLTELVEDRLIDKDGVLKTEKDLERELFNPGPDDTTAGIPATLSWFFGRTALAAAQANAEWERQLKTGQ